jgi:uncharacterized protein
MKNVLIAGASGLVGQVLQGILEKKGYRVMTLSHSKPTDRKVGRFHWNPERGEIDEACFDGVNYVINLAGVGVFDQRWTSSYKKAIRDSRVNSTALLVKAIAKQAEVKVFVNASAIGIYGADTGEGWLDESSALGDGFLAQVVKDWEHAFFSASLPDVRRVALRIGIVLSPKGGALPQFVLPIKYQVGSPLGSGQQYISWIHIDDLANMFLFALETATVQGIYNAGGMEPATNAQLTQALAKRLNKKLWMPNVPSFALKLILGGEKAETVLGGNRVKCDKIQHAGFVFQYKTLTEALHRFF